MTRHAAVKHRRETPRRDRIQSVDRALRILGAFTHTEPVLGVTPISRRLGLTKGVVFRALQTMLDAGFLERDKQTEGYRIGLRAFEVGSQYTLSATLEVAALQPMQDLADHLRHNVYLATLDGRQVVYLSVVDGGGPIKIHAAVGSRAYAHATAVGKVMLAFMPPPDVQKLLAKVRLEAVTPRTIVGVRALESELQRIRRLGYAVNKGENLLGVGSVAAPIRGRSGDVIAGISNGFSLHQGVVVDWRQLGKELVTCARVISRRLGGQES